MELCILNAFSQYHKLLLEIMLPKEIQKDFDKFDNN